MNPNKLIRKKLKQIETLLVNKNRMYGNSVLDPIRIFSRAQLGEQIGVRIDDKLSRILSGQLDDDEDVRLDLIGYLIFDLIRLDQERSQAENKKPRA